MAAALFKSGKILNVIAIVFGFSPDFTIEPIIGYAFQKAMSCV